ncbi:MAG: hypothetical protein K0Q79_586 [Flavipsychrobacter sp.]|jgi:hypothetical protein|nr:hypothetical protein [Flavipsychrobacter sp.]
MGVDLSTPKQGCQSPDWRITLAHLTHLQILLILVQTVHSNIL